MTTYPAGIDISHWQVKTPPLGTSLEFVFVKATEGTSVDPRYHQHAANVLSAHKILGAYHFNKHGVSPKAQASAFLNTIGKNVHLVALDIEGDAGTHFNDAEARIFIQAVQATGRKVGVYASESGFPHVGQDWNWVAKWGDTPPSGTWAFWQWGIVNHVDRDRFHGTMAQLRALAGDPVHYVASVPTGVALRLFTVESGVVTGRRIITTDHPMVRRPCSAPHKYPWPGHLARHLVKLDKDGPYIDAKYADAL